MLRKGARFDDVSHYIGPQQRVRKFRHTIVAIVRKGPMVQPCLLWYPFSAIPYLWFANEEVTAIALALKITKNFGAAYHSSDDTFSFGSQMSYYYFRNLLQSN